MPSSTATATSSPSASAIASYAGCQVFPAGDYYNFDVSAAPIAADSAAQIATTNALSGGGFAFGTGDERINLATSATSTHSVTGAPSYHAAEFAGVPWPWQTGFFIEDVPNGGKSGDNHGIVLNTDTCHLYETYATTWNASSSTLGATSGGNWDLSKPFLTNQFAPSAGAGGLSILAGAIKWEGDLENGAINHALNFFVAQGANGPGISLPADSSGSGGPSGGLNYGAHLRLHATFPETGTPQMIAVIEALKKYGMYLADTGSAGDGNGLFVIDPADGNASHFDFGGSSKFTLADFDVIAPAYSLASPAPIASTAPSAAPTSSPKPLPSAVATSTPAPVASASSQPNVSVLPSCCESASLAFDAAGDAVVTVRGNNAAVNVTYSGALVESVTVSGGTLITGGSGNPVTAYTTKTADPMTVTFLAPAPAPVQSPSVYYFPTSVYYQPLPANPNLVSAAQSAAWQADQSPSQFASFWISEDGSNPNDGSDPLYDMVSNPIAMTVSCDKQSYSSGNCKNTGGNVNSLRNMNGAAIASLPAGAITEGTTDQHVSGGMPTYIDNFWNARPVPSSPGTFHVGGAGECSKAGNGSGCSGATATNIALQLGLVQARELYACMTSKDPTCVLPHAISIAVRCDGPGIDLPATASDAQCFSPSTGANQSTSAKVPEGKRGGINATFAQINALYPPFSYQAIIYRTMSIQAYGFVIRDSAYSQGPGLAIQWQSGQEFAFQHQHDPWTDVAALAGIPWNSSGVQFPLGWAPPLVFCAGSDGTCK